MSREIHPSLKVRDYVFEERIGVGGMGEVWRARHTILQRTVAIKVMARHLEADAGFGQRFLQEAQSQAQLNHPRIVGVSDFFSEDGQYFLVMPLMSGKTLADRMDEARGALPVSEALAVARDVLDALDYAHQKGVIHRDVKPSNILLDAEGHACLTDFGIALSLGKNRFTRTGASLGTPHYMSPEQIRTPRSVDHRTDVYSFGCVFYEMLAGRPPFSEAADAEDTDFALKEAHVYKQPDSIRKWNPKIPGWLDALVLRALAKKPDERFSGCGEMRRALDAPPAPPSPPLPKRLSPAVQPPAVGGVGVRREKKGRPTTLITTAFTLLLAALVLAVYFSLRDNVVMNLLDGEQPAEPMNQSMGMDLNPVEPMGTDMEAEPMGTDMTMGEPMGTDMAAPDEEPAVVPVSTAPPPLQDTSGGQKAVNELNGILSSGGSKDHEILLEQGSRYAIFGSCDSDCSDLDLVLYPSVGMGPVDSDVTADSRPDIFYSPTETRSFVLRVNMVNCSATWCSYAIQIMREEGP